MTPGTRAFLLGIALCTVIVLSAAASDTPPTLALPKVHIIATGGTIAGTAPNSTELVAYSPSTIGVATLIASVPELNKYAEVRGEQFCTVISDDMTPALWLNLSRRVNALLHSSDTDGVVITQGTDTLEETAYFLNLVTTSDKPVVVTAAMRPSTALSADGPLNLLDAVRLAGSPAARGKGVLIALNGQINAARETTKTNTVMVETFRSPDFGLLGYMDDGRARFYRLPARNHTFQTEFDLSGVDSLPRVDIVLVYTGMDTTVIDALVAKNTRGIIIDSMGDAGYPSCVLPSLKAAAESGIPVVISSRTGTGITTARDGFISADTLSPQKARILLMLALTETQDPGKIADMFRKY